jgi:dolichyl-phosphate-mannose-protein mannosyltransferase
MLSRRKLFALLLGAGILSRFLFLSQPRQVIFDEVHWGKFITGYCCTQENFFDVHPPHGKLLIARFSKLLGYTGNQSFDPIGTPYTNINPLAIRFFPALAGSVIPAIVFLLILELGGSLVAAFLAGYFLLFDNALLLQSRLMGLYPCSSFPYLAQY